MPQPEQHGRQYGGPHRPERGARQPVQHRPEGDLLQRDGGERDAHEYLERDRAAGRLPRPTVGEQSTGRRQQRQHEVDQRHQRDHYERPQWTAA